MADPREAFAVAVDDTTQDGEFLIARVEGEVAAAKEGIIGFSFKDSSGNVILPQLTAEGKVPVDTESIAGTCLSASGEVAADSTSLVDIATITGALTKTYSKFGVIASCRRASLFQLQYIDDAAGTPATTVLAEYIVGAGQYTVSVEIGCLIQSTSGGTGTQEFKLQAKNFHALPLSSLRGTLATIET